MKNVSELLVHFTYADDNVCFDLLLDDIREEK